MAATFARSTAARRRLVVLLALVVLCTIIAVHIVTNPPANKVGIASHPVTRVAPPAVASVATVRTLTLTIPWSGLRDLHYSTTLAGQPSANPLSKTLVVYVSPVDYSMIAAHYDAEELINLGPTIMRYIGLQPVKGVICRLSPR